MRAHNPITGGGGGGERGGRGSGLGTAFPRVFFVIEWIGRPARFVLLVNVSHALSIDSGFSLQKLVTDVGGLSFDVAF